VLRLRMLAVKNSRKRSCASSPAAAMRAEGTGAAMGMSWFTNHLAAGRRREGLATMHNIANLAGAIANIARELQVGSAFSKQRLAVDGELVPSRLNGPRR
jgi:hypothetical protein